MRCRAWLLIAGLFALAAPLTAAPSNPVVATVVPRGAMPGTTVKARIYGARLNDAEELLFYEPGVEVLRLKSVPRRNAVDVTLRIAIDAPLGENPFTLRTKTGLSDLHTFWIGAAPVRMESEPNGDLATADPLTFGTTTEGGIRPEDVDVFRLELTEARRVVIEVQGVRLGDTEFDPILTVLTPERRVVATVDDTALGRLDPWLDLDLEAGTWFLELRETAYGGSPVSRYRLHVGAFPRPVACLPMGGRPGEAVAVRYVGRGVDAAKTGVVVVPPDGRGWITHWPESADGIAPSSFRFVVSELPNVVEPEQTGPVQAEVRSSAWSMIGPFPNAAQDDGPGAGHDTVYPPEQEIALRSTYPGKGEKPVRWKRRPEFVDAQVHSFAELLAEPDWSVVYLHRTLTTPVAQTVTALMSSDDTLKVWLNGKPLHEHREHRGVTADSDVVKLPLKKGRNDLLLKIGNGVGGYGFLFRFAPTDLMALARDCSFPAAVHGVIARDGERDLWSFPAKKGVEFEIVAFSRLLRSPLDPVIFLMDASGRVVASNDDAIGVDARLRYRPPQDGEYTVVVRDHLRRGSPQHFYRLEIDRRRNPMRTTVSIPRGLPDFTVSIPRGGRATTLLRSSAIRFDRGLVPVLDGLPEGVTAEIPPYERGTPFVPVLLHASDDAPRAGRLVSVRGRSKPSTDVGYYQEVPLVRVENNQVFVTTFVDRIPVAVTDPAPFTVTLDAPRVPIVRGGPMSLKVTVERKKGFNQAIRLYGLWNPPGLSVGSLTIPASKNEGTLSISARTNARIGTWKIALNGVANDRGRRAVASNFVDLEVSEPWVTARIGKARGEQGKTVELNLTFDAKREFEGAFRARIVNLPRGVKAPIPDVARDTKKCAIPVVFDAKAAKGRHRGLLLRLEVPSAGGPVIHHFRGGELRIDVPQKPRRPASRNAGGSTP